MATWKPGKGWPSQAQLTYVAALVTVLGAAIFISQWARAGRGGPWR